MKLIQKNDLSLLKWFYKLLLNQDNLDELEINEDNAPKIELLIQAYKSLIKNMTEEDDPALPFLIIKTL